jgi:hypothetical protein
MSLAQFVVLRDRRTGQDTFDMAHVMHITPLLLGSFGAGIGLVTVALVLNFIADAVKRAKRAAAQRELPSFAELDARLLVQPTPRQSIPTGSAGMPMIRRRSAP